MTLLDEAKAVQLRHTYRLGKAAERITDEDVELAVAWARGEVRLNQVHAALGKSNLILTQSFLAYALRAAVQRGVIRA